MKRVLLEFSLESPLGFVFSSSLKHCPVSWDIMGLWLLKSVYNPAHSGVSPHATDYISL